MLSITRPSHCDVGGGGGGGVTDDEPAKLATTVWAFVSVKLKDTVVSGLSSSKVSALLQESGE